MSEQVSVDDLKLHPRSTELYGESVDQELIESIRSVGIVVPLLVSKDKFVLAGNSRLRGARHLNLDSVPVQWSELSHDSLEALEVLVHSNKTRIKTNDQMGREARLLLEIEKEKAEHRRLANLNKDKEDTLSSTECQNSDARENTAKSEQKRSDEAVGEQIGVSRDTARKLVEVSKKIDELKESGQSEEAQELTEKLNKSVNAAYKEVVAMQAPQEEAGEEQSEPELPKDNEGQIIPEHLRSLFQAYWDKLSETQSAGRKYATLIGELSSLDGGEGLRNYVYGEKKEMDQLNTVKAHVSSTAPHAVCPQCKGTGGKKRSKDKNCSLCEGHGWVNKGGYRSYASQS